MTEDRMRILYVLPELPYPPDRGGRIVMYNFVRGMMKRHDVWVCSLIHHKEDRQHVEVFREICPNFKVFPAGSRWSSVRMIYSLLSSDPYKVIRFRNRKMMSWVQRCIAENKIDLVHCQNFYTAQYVTGEEPCARVLYKENFETLMLQRYLQGLRGSRLLKWAAGLQVKRTFDYETSICKRFDKVVLISDADRHRFEMHQKDVPLESLPPGVDLEYYRPSPQQPVKSRVVFTGSMNYFPNVDAVNFFCSSVWPIVRKSIPDAEFLIVGQRPEAAIQRWHGKDGIRVTGRVDDVRPFAEESAVYVVPLRIAGGVRLKILEAMAMGKAVVSTSIGAEGLDLAAGRDLLVADRPQEMARQVIALLTDTNKRVRLETQARAFAERHGDWDKQIDRLEAIYREVCRHQ